MAIFRTGLHPVPAGVQEPRPPFNGAGWSARFTELGDPQSTQSMGQEVVIEAASWVTGQRSLNLIVSSLILYKGDPALFSRERLLAFNEHEPDCIRGWERKGLPSSRLQTLHIPTACSLAAKASRRRKAVHAISNYNFSVSLFGVFGVDLEPGSDHLCVSKFPDDHVLFSHAILAAYSSLEDLGLELRASGTKPSRIGGKWNPDVRNELEDRLRSAGINVEEPILWALRGPKRRVERARPIPVVQTMAWNGGPVRDAEIELAEAIAYADWLRDRVAAHNVKRITASLSPYDVVNVQHLARRLLLESHGFWKTKGSAATRL